MKNNQEEDKSLSFVKRWISAFNRILRLFENKQVSNNTEFVDKFLNDEKQNARTQEELDILAEKRSLLEELCEDVDVYYEKKAAAEKATDLNQWFDKEVNTFVNETIPDATDEDVIEVREQISSDMDKDILIRASILESEFKPETEELGREESESEEFSIYKSDKENGDE